jgi:flagellar assembly protein FliH
MQPAAFDFPALEPIEGAALHQTRDHVAEARAEADTIRAAAHAEGLAAGREEALAAVQPIAAMLQSALEGVAALRDRVAAESEEAAVDLAFAIAGHALQGAIDADPARVVDVVRGALRRLVERERVTVLVHPDDLDLVREAVPGLIAQLGGMEHCEVQAERRVARGGALVRTVEGEVDATLATKLERARETVRESALAAAATDVALEDHGA